MSQSKNTQHGNTEKKTIAVFFGGRSPEHDVSVISALQVMQAIEPHVFTALPVYIAPNGNWYIGEALHKRENFLFDEAGYKSLTQVTLDVSADRGGALLPVKQPFFGSAKPISFDVAIPCFHGLYGEDGNIQGLFELANIPYTGMRTKASSLLMDKVTTKHFLQAIGVPALDFAVIKRPTEGYLVPEEELEALLKGVGYPCIIKPSHLGSSIGVAKVNSAAEAKACLPAIFEFDDCAIAEPYVENLVEYNVAISSVFGALRTSAFERPKSTAELLDFKQKYMSGSDSKTGEKLGNKTFSSASEGMLSLTRDINPELPEGLEEKMRGWAEKMFTAIDGTGAPRIDFIGNSKTGEVWMNEVNPCPGSFGYFLWEACRRSPELFTDLVSALIDEAIACNVSQSLPRDPVPEEARILKRRG